MPVQIKNQEPQSIANFVPRQSATPGVEESKAPHTIPNYATTTCAAAKVPKNVPKSSESSVVSA